MSDEPLEILDATLRDGSYVIDFQFTAEDTSLIASTLESAGVGLIEVGHGLGLGAARAGKGDQAASDEEYLRAAAHALKSARFGAFFIPGVGVEDDLRLAADCGVHFIRIGCNVNALDEAGPFIEAAKKLGFTVFSNLMKSYAVPPEEFGACGKRAEEYGADVLCLVDSAGGMLPEDVAEYLRAARAACGLRLDFHGHNNLSMAVANTVAAYDAGATILDTSLQGMGRSEGNAATEATVAILQKRGLLEHIDVNALLDASGAFVRPLLHNKGFSSLGITSGRAKFHSSFLGRVMEAAKAAAVDPRDLILRLCEFDQIEAPDELVGRVAAELAETGPKPPIRFSIPPYRDEGGAPLVEQVRLRAAELKEKGRKLNIPSVLNVVVSAIEPAHVSPFVETAFGCALSNVMLEDGELLADIFRAVDGVVDYVLLDSPGLRGQSILDETGLLRYSDPAMWSRAVVNHVVQLLDGHLTEKRVALVGDDNLVRGVGKGLIDLGVELRVSSTDGSKGENAAIPGAISGAEPLEELAANVDALVALSPRTAAIIPEVAERMRAGALLYDGGIGSLAPEAMAVALRNGVRVVRVDLRPALAATALELIHFRSIVDENMGREMWDGVPVVAGGLIGDAGDIVVDNIFRPTRVIGIADGNGGILDPGANGDSVLKVRHVIASRRLIEPEE